MTAALPLQKGLRTLLAESEPVLQLVPAESILDRNARPAPFPSIIFGEDQEVDEERIARDTVRVYSTLHIWDKSIGLVSVKEIDAAVRSAIKTARANLAVDGFHVADCYVSGTRFARDPDPDVSHAIVTVETLLRENG